MKIKKHKKSGLSMKRGFTLQELTIVIALIGIVMGVSLVSMQGVRARSNLRASQRELAATIKLAQSYALQGKVVGGSTPETFGVQFSGDTTYVLYGKTGGTVTNLESHVLAGGTKITTYPTEKTVSFVVPHGQVDMGNLTENFDSGSGSNDSLKFILGNGSESLEIVVNANGSIVEN